VRAVQPEAWSYQQAWFPASRLLEQQLFRLLAPRPPDDVV